MKSPYITTPMIAKLVVLGEDRPDALRKMKWALKQYIILGVTTNISFLREVIAHKAFQRGETTTDFVEQYFANWQPAAEVPDVALIAAALSEMLKEAQTNQQLDEETTTSAPYNPWQRLPKFRVGEKTWGD